MWWVVGLVAALILLLIIKRGRKMAAHRALVVTAQNQIRTSFFMLTHELPSSAELNPRFWDDEYLLGYAQGSVALMTKFFGNNLSTEEKGLVFVDAIRGLAPSRWQEVCERVAALANWREPNFARGFEHAGNVIGLSLNRLRPEVLTEPDIQAALADAPATERLARQIFGPDEVKGDTPFSSAAVSLMTTYMDRHRKLAGY
jgi:hypothetical protein